MLPETSRAEPVLEARDVYKYFGDLVALKGVDLRLVPGNSVLLWGPNGAGKTTLLRILAGLSRPNQGEVLFEGQSLDRNPAASKAAVGFVSHAALLYGELTGRENLRFFGRLFGLRQLEKKIDAALDLFDMRERADEPVRGLSRGLVQRATLARAFLHQPRFLLLDEPFTGLDAEAATDLLNRANTAGVPARVIGQTGGQELRIAVDGQAAIAVGISEAERIWSNAVEHYFAKRVA